MHAHKWEIPVETGAPCEILFTDHILRMHQSPLYMRLSFSLILLVDQSMLSFLP